MATKNEARRSHPPSCHEVNITPNLARRPPQGPCRTSGDDSGSCRHCVVPCCRLRMDLTTATGILSRCVHRCARHARTTCTRLRCGAGCFGGLCCTDRALHVGRAAACLAGPAAVCLPLHKPRRMRTRTLDRPSTRLRLQSGDAELAENASDAESSAEEDDEGELLVPPPPPPCDHHHHHHSTPPHIRT